MKLKYGRKKRLLWSVGSYERVNSWRNKESILEKSYLILFG